MNGYYVLDADGEAVPAADAAGWASRWRDGDAWRVGQDEIAPGVEVSTVFLGLDHGRGDGPPLIWETMVFAADHPAIDQSCERCSTRAEAVAQHARALDEARAHLAACDGGCAWEDEA